MVERALLSRTVVSWEAYVLLASRRLPNDADFFISGRWKVGFSVSNPYLKEKHMLLIG